MLPSTTNDDKGGPAPRTKNEAFSLLSIFIQNPCIGLFPVTVTGTVTIAVTLTVTFTSPITPCVLHQPASLIINQLPLSAPSPHGRVLRL